MINLKDKWVLVTGAAKRIGAEIATAFAGEGCHILLHYHKSKKDVEVIRAKIKNAGSKAECFSLDLTDTQAVHQWCEKESSRISELSGIIHSASIFHPLDADSHIRKRRAIHEIHTHSPLHISETFCRHSRNLENFIINITDAMIERPYPGYHDYFMSKSALAEQTRVLAVTYAANVRINSVAPGCILFPENYDESRKETILKGVPLKREGRAADIANACVFLAKHPYITGQCLKVDGGRSL